MAKPKETNISKEKPSSELELIATTTNEQAPSISFAPYSDQYHLNSFSNTLLEKANKLADKIWNGDEGYRTYHRSTIYANFDVEKEVIEKNKSYFDSAIVSTTLYRLFSISFNNANDNPHYNNIKITELIKKIRKLERRYISDDIVDEDVREQIINHILTPTHMGGSFGQSYTQPVQFRYPIQKSVVNGIMSSDDMCLLENIISYIPKVRSLLSKFRPASGYPIKSKRLLKKWMIEKNEYSSPDDNRQFLSDLLNFSNFFNCALPYEIYSDYVTAIKYPTLSSQRYENLITISNNLRDMSVGYIQEQKTLSDLLQSIIDLNDALLSYFVAIVKEIDECFNFINRIGITFDKLVEESEERINDSEYPF